MNRASGINLTIALVLILATFLVYGRMLGHQFVNIDDPVYVSQNPYVASGLTGKGVKWAFTTTRAEFWQPLTWLSYMVDTQLFGLRPAGYLFTNLLLHILNALLVFLIFKRMTAAVWPGAFVAALFALHPLHVESVAWIAERKDVLSALFWMLTIYAYLYYTDNPGYKTYLAVCLFFILGLMAKPMLVTLPCVLLLLDYWPLGRAKSEGKAGISLSVALEMIREKLPLFAIATGFSIIAFLAQKSGGGIGSVDHFSLADRIYNALISYSGYLWKIIWPQKLAAFYPFPEHFAIWQVTGAAVLLAGITILALRTAGRHPFFIVGWLWYLGTLVPVIGLIKIGDFAMADRYMYIPLIGPSIIIAWGVPAVFARISLKPYLLTAAAAVILTVFSFITYKQVRVWTDSFTLLKHALQVTENNFFAHYGLGHAYAGRGDYDTALTHFSKAVQFKPSKATLYNDLGRCLVGQSRFTEANDQFLAALDIAPRLPATHFYLANLHLIQKRFESALFHFSEALRLHPDMAGHRSDNHTTLPDYHELTSRYAGAEHRTRAIEQNREILIQQPHNLNALRNLVIAYSVKGDHERALVLLKINPSISDRKRAIIRGYTDWPVVHTR